MAMKHLGNFAACEPWAAVHMECEDCQVSWLGCWDNFECPNCRKGELPYREEMQTKGELKDG